MKAVILAGGLGKRLRPLTDSRPKPMIQVAGIPILEWQINWLRRNGIKEIIICIGYLKSIVLDHVGSGQKFGVSVGYSVEEEPLGTAGAIKNARALIGGDRFIAMNGDIITDLDPLALSSDMDLNRGTLGSIAAVPLRSPYGIIEMSDGLARQFREKPILPEYWINAGVYCLATKIIDSLADKGDLEGTILPYLASKERICVTKFASARWKSIDTHKDIEEAETEFADLRRGGEGAQNSPHSAAMAKRASSES